MPEIPWSEILDRYGLTDKEMHFVESGFERIALIKEVRVGADVVFFYFKWVARLFDAGQGVHWKAFAEGEYDDHISVSIVDLPSVTSDEIHFSFPGLEAEILLNERTDPSTIVGLPDDSA